MKIKRIILSLILSMNIFAYSQEKYIEKYENGNIKIDGYIFDKTLDSIFKEYYENGEIKQEGFFRNCNYETNRIKLYTSSCGYGNSSELIQNGKKHGTWKSYYTNGKIQSITNYHCNFSQGNFYYYDENEHLESLEFYNQGDLLTSIEYFKNGNIEKNSIFTYEHNKKISKNLKTTIELDYYEDGKLKIQRKIIEKENDTEIEYVKEYFQNGFLKEESELKDSDKDGVYREYYENGNVKYAGKFKDDKPIEKQYFYHENGKQQKIEYWKKGKLIKTEIK
jgi:antitoxin component YwqK of YwqJK toxin-antitoxin module